MITVKINNQMTKQEEKEMNLRDHPEIKFTSETSDKAVATLGKIATVIIRGNRFEKDLEEEKERAAEICDNYTNGEIMTALALMAYKKENDLNKLPGYYAELMRSFQSAPIWFYPFIKNEEELREELKGENIDDIDEYLTENGHQYFYTEVGTLFLNL